MRTANDGCRPLPVVSSAPCNEQSAIAAALSQKATTVDKMEDALTPETFLLQACSEGTIELQRSSTAVLKRECKEPGSFLVWQFSVGEDPNAKIGFVVRRKPAQKKRQIRLIGVPEQNKKLVPEEDTAEMEEKRQQ